MQNETAFGTTPLKYGKLVIELLQQKGCNRIKTRDEELTCCCPFHEDENPSFGINLTSGAYKCFACDEKGSIVNFIAKMKNISNKEAWQELRNLGLVDGIYLGYTIEDFAQEKHFEVKFLQQFNITTSENGMNVSIPYYDENSQLVRTRYRNNPNNEPRFYWGPRQ